MHTGLAEVESKYGAALDALKVTGEKHLEQQVKEAKAEEKAMKELEESHIHNVEVMKKRGKRQKLRPRRKSKTMWKRSHNASSKRKRPSQNTGKGSAK